MNNVTGNLDNVFTSRKCEKPWRPASHDAGVSCSKNMLHITMLDFSEHYCTSTAHFPANYLAMGEITPRLPSLARFLMPMLSLPREEE
jgi:hypothetical protein